MRTVKMVGLAAVAALAAMALIGAGSASATLLCKQAESPCAEANRHPAGTTLKADSDEVVFEHSGGPGLICEDSDLSAKTTAKSGSPLGVEFTSWTFGECRSAAYFNIPCTLSVSTLPTGGIEWTSGFDGVLDTVTPKITMVCGTNPHYYCVIREGAVELDLNGSESEPTLVASKDGPLPAAKLMSCNKVLGTESPTLSATYTFSAPKPFWVTQ